MAALLLSGVLERMARSTRRAPGERIPRTRPNGKVLRYWLCTNHHKLGLRACANKWHLPYDAVTETVLGHFDRITPSVVEEMVAHELARCLEGLKGLMERDRLEQELGRRQPAEIMAKLEHLDGVGPDLQRALVDWQAQAITLAIRSVCGPRPVLESRPEGCQLLRRILTSPLTVTPDVDAGRLLGWDYVGEAVLGPLMGRLELETPSNSLRIP